VTSARPGQARQQRDSNPGHPPAQLGQILGRAPVTPRPRGGERAQPGVDESGGSGQEARCGPGRDRRGSAVRL